MKCYCNKSFNALLEILNRVLSSRVGSPKSSYETKRLIVKSGLGYRKFMHALLIVYCIRKTKSMMKYATNVVYLDDNLMSDR